jgi:hypothetical protein
MRVHFTMRISIFYLIQKAEKQVIAKEGFQIPSHVPGLLYYYGQKTINSIINAFLQ